MNNSKLKSGVKIQYINSATGNYYTIKKVLWDGAVETTDVNGDTVTIEKAELVDYKIIK